MKRPTVRSALFFPTELLTLSVCNNKLDLDIIWMLLSPSTIQQRNKAILCKAV